MKKFLFFTVILAAFAFSISAQYTEVYTQPCFSDVGNLYTSALDTADNINYEIADNFVNVTDPIKKVEFYGACGAFSGDWFPGTPNAQEPFIIRFYQQVTDWTVPPEPLTAPETGTYTVKLYDSYGDGWNGSQLDVLVNGVVVLDDITLPPAMVLKLKLSAPMPATLSPLSSQPAAGLVKTGMRFSIRTML